MLTYRGIFLGGLYTGIYLNRLFYHFIFLKANCLLSVVYADLRVLATVGWMLLCVQLGCLVTKSRVEGAAWWGLTKIVYIETMISRTREKKRVSHTSLEVVLCAYVSGRLRKTLVNYFCYELLKLLTWFALLVFVCSS